MARYTCSFTINAPFTHLPQLLVDLLQRSCNLEVIYDRSDYIMARETPGQVSFSKLVTVEVLIDRNGSSDTETRINFVIKNDELPLQVDNHCHQVFETVDRAVTNYQNWQVVENISGQVN